MEWIIEYINGKKLVEKLDLFYPVNLHLINKIYFTDSNNQYGFYYSSGMFFINNKVFDFKININNSQIIPLQYKTGTIIFNSKENEIVAWNVGYRLVDNIGVQEYILSIQKDQHIYLIAKKYNKNRELFKVKELKLQ